MINPECFSSEWITKQKQLLGQVDPGILEKSIYALALLGNLVDAGLPFVFKGGTSLLLHLNPIRRLSIDIDIFCAAAGAELDEVLTRIGTLAPFTGFEESSRGARGLPNRRHFKFFYISPTQGGRTLHILLDVVEEGACPVVVETKAIRTPFIDVRREVLVTLPTIEGLLGDKLTAFAPRTTGVPFVPANGNPCDTMQVIKQLFDVAELFDAMQDLAATAIAYDAMLELENGYRGGKFTKEQVLTDTRDACLNLSMHELKGAPKDHPDALLLVDGASRLRSHLIQTRFSRGDACIAASKVALLSTLLLHERIDIALGDFRFDRAPDSLVALKQLQIASPGWLPLNKLKGSNPEAFFYWQKADEIEVLSSANL